jgi:hypothetical protein
VETKAVSRSLGERQENQEALKAKAFNGSGVKRLVKTKRR